MIEKHSQHQIKNRLVPKETKKSEVLNNSNPEEWFKAIRII